MSDTTIAQAYTSKSTRSTSEPWADSNWDAIGAQIKDGLVVCWLHYELLFGRITNGAVSFPNVEALPNIDKHLVRLRAFNKDKELHLWRSGQDVKGRLRVDTEGDTTDYIETDLYLWGNPADGAPEGYVHLKEERGWDAVVPFDGTLPKNGVLRLATRNYIGYDEETCQAGYVDSRFVSIHNQ